MEDDSDLEPIKEVHIIKSHADIEWLVPIDDNHRVSISRGENINWAAMKRWCEQHSQDTVVIWPSMFSEVRFYFFRKSDAAAFKLRWT